MITIRTIGYERSKLHEFIDRLLEDKVTLLVDVREYPLSRKAGFSKKALCLALEEVGITYQHWRELGAPKEIRHALRKDKDWSAYVDAYKSLLNKRENVLHKLSEQAEEESICLMCFERDFRECHRSLIVERMRHIELLGEVKHIEPRTAPVATAA